MGRSRQASVVQPVGFKGLHRLADGLPAGRRGQVFALKDTERLRLLNNNIHPIIRLATAAKKTRHQALRQQQLVAQALKPWAFQLAIGQCPQAIWVERQIRGQGIQPVPDFGGCKRGQRGVGAGGGDGWG